MAYGHMVALEKPGWGWLFGSFSLGVQTRVWDWDGIDRAHGWPLAGAGWRQCIHPGSSWPLSNIQYHWSWNPFGPAQGIEGGQFLCWLSFLQGRFQSVLIEEKTSSLCPLFCGLPQRSFSSSIQHLYEAAGWGDPSVWGEISSVCRWHPASYLYPRPLEWCRGHTIPVSGGSWGLGGTILARRSGCEYLDTPSHTHTRRQGSSICGSGWGWVLRR